MKISKKRIKEIIREEIVKSEILTEGKSFHNKKFKSKVEDGYINWEVIGETDKNGRYKVRIHRHYIHKPKTGHANIRQNTSDFVYLTFSNEKDNNGTPYWNNYTTKSIINNYTNKNKIQKTFDVIKDKYGSQAQATSKGKLSKTSRNLVNRGWGMNVEGKLNEGLKRFKVYVSGEKEPLILLGKNEKEVKQTAYAMIRNSSVKVRKVVKEAKLNETWDGPQGWSSKEAKEVVDGALKNYAKDLRKVQYKVVKDWMSKAKSGVIDYFDLIRGLTTGDMSRAHPYETEFLHKVLTKDKIINRFRSYFGGKKGFEKRRKNQRGM